MGNALIDDGVLRDNTDLGKYVKNFLIQNHQITNDSKFKDSMKKRACCRNTHQVPVTIASYDPKSKKVLPTQVMVNVFDKPEDVNSANCKFNDKDFSPINKGGEGGKGYRASAQCSSFYNNLCNTVYDQRQKYNGLDKLYGPYPDIPLKGSQPQNWKDLGVGNGYPDCNCLNSVFVRGDIENAPGTPDIPADKKAMNFDNRCTLNIPFGGAYVENYNGPESLNICVNSVKVGGDIVAANQAAASIKQSCSANQTNANSNTGAQAGSGQTSNTGPVDNTQSTAGVGPGSGGNPPPASGGSTTPASGGPTTPASGGPTTPASGGSTTPASGGPTTPASGGSTTPAPKETTTTNNSSSTSSPDSGTGSASASASTDKPPTSTSNTAPVPPSTPTPAAAQAPATPAAPEAPASNNNMIYIGIGVTVLILIIVFFMMSGGGKSKEDSSDEE